MARKRQRSKGGQEEESKRRKGRAELSTLLETSDNRRKLREREECSREEEIEVGEGMMSECFSKLESLD